MIYAVFRQDTPKQCGDEWVANLRYMGNVEAANIDSAFEQAKKQYCAAPVLQEGSMQ